MNDRLIIIMASKNDKNAFEPELNISKGPTNSEKNNNF